MHKSIIKDRGFSIIEVTIAAGITALISVVSVYAYLDYAPKSQVSEAMALMNKEKVKIQKNMANGTCSSENSGEVGKFGRLTVSGTYNGIKQGYCPTGCVMTYTVNNDGVSSRVKGKQLVADLLGSNVIALNSATNVPSRYIPRALTAISSPTSNTQCDTQNLDGDTLLPSITNPGGVDGEIVGNPTPPAPPSGGNGDDHTTNPQNPGTGSTNPTSPGGATPPSSGGNGDSDLEGGRPGWVIQPDRNTLTCSTGYGTLRNRAQKVVSNLMYPIDRNLSVVCEYWDANISRWVQLGAITTTIRGSTDADFHNKVYHKWVSSESSNPEITHVEYVINFPDNTVFKGEIPRSKFDASKIEYAGSIDYDCGSESNCTNTMKRNFENTYPGVPVYDHYYQAFVNKIRQFHPELMLGQTGIKEERTPVSFTVIEHKK